MTLFDEVFQRHREILVKDAIVLVEGHFRFDDFGDENDFFGEMSLLTGEPRTANVIAVSESEVLRIEKSGLQPIFESNPALVEAVSELVDERREMLRQSHAAQATEQVEGTRVLWAIESGSRAGWCTSTSATLSRAMSVFATIRRLELGSPGLNRVDSLSRTSNRYSNRHSPG